MSWASTTTDPPLPTRRPRIFLDANILVDVQLRDFFLSADEAKLIDVRWSRKVLDETERALVVRLQLSPTNARRAINFMTVAFPEGEVRGFAPLEGEVVLPDPDDRHVLAAAVHGECELLVTNNVRDFPDDAVLPHDLDVMDANEAILWLVARHGDAMADVVEEMLTKLRRPQVDRAQFLARLSGVAPEGAMALGHVLGDERFSRLLVDTLDAESLSSPQEGVRSLLDLAGADDDGSALADLVDPACAEQLTGSADATPDALRRALREALADFFEEPSQWGYGTARRPLSPGVELVNLVRSGSRVRVEAGRQLPPGHVFRVEHRDQRWVLLQLNGSEPTPADLGSAQLPP